MFAPEFRNRLDAIITFAHLSQEVIAMVVEKFVLQLEAQLDDRDVTIELTDEAAKWLIENGYDELMGARPMARVIQEHIKKPLADEVLFGRLKIGRPCPCGRGHRRDRQEQARLRIPRRAGDAAAGKAARAAPRQEAPRLSAAEAAGRPRGNNPPRAPRLRAESAARQGVTIAVNGPCGTGAVRLRTRPQG